MFFRRKTRPQKEDNSITIESEPKEVSELLDTESQIEQRLNDSNNRKAELIIDLLKADDISVEYNGLEPVYVYRKTLTKEERSFFMDKLKKIL